MKKRADDNGWLRVGLLLRNVKIFPEREEKITRAFDSLGFHNRSQKKKNTTRQKSTKKIFPARAVVWGHKHNTNRTTRGRKRARAREREREREKRKKKKKKSALSRSFCFDFLQTCSKRERERRGVRGFYNSNG